MNGWMQPMVVYRDQPTGVSILADPRATTRVYYPSFTIGQLHDSNRRHEGAFSL